MTKIPRVIITTLLCVLGAITAAGAQERFLPPVSPADTAVRVSLLTCGPGTDVYELEGHSGLRMQYGDNDVTVHWGLFDFASPGFVYRFVKGETDYSIGASSTSMFLYAYARTGRSVTEQELRLTTAQAARLVELVNDNLQPEKRIYRYNYVLDNCATRPLAMIERATGDSVTLHSTYEALGQSPTFRSEMRHFHADYPWYQFGIDLALGSGLDRTITARETMFAPVVMQQLLADATIKGPDDTEIPLIRSTRTLLDGAPADTLPGPTPWPLTPMAATLLLLAVTVAITWFDWRRHTVSRWWDAILFGVYGILGCIIAFLILVSVHEATSPNWLILWLNPLCLLVPALTWVKRARLALTIFMGASAAATLLLAILFAAGVQTPNAAFFPMMLAGIVRQIYYVITYTRGKRQKA